MSEIIWLKDLAKHNKKMVGEQARQLSDLHQNKISVPDMFVITSKLTHSFFESGNFIEEIEPLLKDINLLKPEEIQLASANIKKIIQGHQLPDEIAIQLAKAYNQIGSNKWVELNFSSTQDILPDRILDVFHEHPIRAKGDANFLHAYKDILERLFSPEVIAFRHRHNLSNHHLDVAIMVTLIPDVQTSGVATTIDEIHGNKHLINIEAVWGMYDELLSGMADADFYQVEKNTWRIDQTHHEKQEYQRPAKDPNHRKKMRWGSGNKQKLSQEEIVELAKLAHKLGNQLFFPQRISWLKDKQSFYVLDSERIELDHQTALGLKADNPTINKPRLSQGISISPGISDGKIRQIQSISSNSLNLNREDIVVVDHLTDEAVEKVKGAAGVIAEHGNYSAHAAVVLRSAGIPAIGDIHQATERFKNGDKVTINGLTGEVFSGSISLDKKSKSQPPQKIVRTVTKTFVYSRDPESSHDLTNELIDGVYGLSSNWLVQKMNAHPQSILDGHKTDFQKQLSDAIKTVCEHAGQRPVYYSLLNMSQADRLALPYSAKFESDNRAKDFSGLDFLLDHSQWLHFELQQFQLLKKDHDNLKLVLPNFKSKHEISRLNKVLPSTEVPKEYWLSICSPAGLHEISHLNNSHISGLILELDQFLSNYYLDSIDHLIERGWQLKDSEPVAHQFKTLAETSKNLGIGLVINQGKIELNTHLLHDLVSKNLTAMVSREERLIGLRHELASAEHWHLK